MYVAEGLGLVILLLLSGLVSGSEVAFFSMSPHEIINFKNGNIGEKIIYKLISKPKRLLATILIMNNLINFAPVIRVLVYLSFSVVMFLAGL